MSKEPDSSIRLYSYADDQPREGQGTLIPRKGNFGPKPVFSPTNISGGNRKKGVRAATAVLGLCALVILGTTGYGLVSQTNLVATPVVTIVDPYTQSATTLDYGPQIALSKSNFFIETRDAFIDEGVTFIEADMTRKQLRFFKKGVLLQSAEILGIGEEGSWWETPSGLYQIEQKDERVFQILVRRISRGC